MIGTLLDIYTITKEGKAIIKLTFKGPDGNLFFLEDLYFRPYFYLIVRDNKDLTAIEEDKAKYKIFNVEVTDSRKNIPQIEKFVNTTLTEDEIRLGKFLILKLEFDTIPDLIEYRQKITQEIYFKGKFEYDIPYDIRYCLDKGIYALHKYNIDEKKMTLNCLGEDFDYNILSLDIETLANKKINPESDPIVLISLYSPEQNIKKVITYKIPAKKESYVVVVKDEKELLHELIETIKKSKTHFLVTYNGDNYDLPYIRKRAKILGLTKELDSVLEYKSHTTTSGTTCYTKGIQHIDAYKIVNTLNRIGAINLIHLKLNDVYKFFFNKTKIDLDYKDMKTHYNDPKLLAKFIEYNLVDSIAAYEIAKNFIIQYIKMSQTTGLTIQDTIRASSSSLVEALLMRETIARNKIVPNIPKDEAVNARAKKSYEGGYVREPKQGLHENIAVLDFQSFHPSIIITYNISAESLGVKNCIRIEESPIGDKFCQDTKATIPDVLEKLLDARLRTKEEMKKYDKNSTEYKTLYAEQWSQKILLNSTYGYLAYPRARWYCFECARSILKYTHKYIHYVIGEAKKNGMETIYSDTDSDMLTYKNKEDVFKFVDNINEKLPGRLHLSIDGFYKRGIFVAKKSDEKEGAKKRYALIDEKGELKITGFETVRRDWSYIAKRTQKSVLETILKIGDIEKAADIVKKAIKDLKEGKVKKEDLIIISKIRKGISDYSAIGPHIAAVNKAKKEGIEIDVGTLVEYIITKTGKTISEKAQLAELSKEGDYDIDYYIRNQILPSVSNIFSVFKYDENKLLQEPTQKKLF